MAARYCTTCGNLVTTTFCPSCGATQPTGSDQPEIPTQAWSAPLTPFQEGGGHQHNHPTDPRLAQQYEPQQYEPQQYQQHQPPYQPFEQPAWDPNYQDQPYGAVPLVPESGPVYAPPVDQASLPPALPQHFGNASGTGEFMGVSNWQTEPRRSNRTNWILGGLAAAAVIAVLVAIAFVIINSNSEDDIATPDTGFVPTTIIDTPTVPSTPSTTSTTTSAPGTGGNNPGSAVPPPMTVTVTADTTTQAPTSVESSESVPETSSVPVTPEENPRGGPDRQIACNSGYIVQVASALTDADFQARVAELRANGQLPADVAVATTDGSCQIFTSQTNTIVLYAGPFPDKYAACAARLSGAPDSFIKGTTPETAAEYVSCLCPAAVDQLPVLNTLNQTGTWVGELQRVLANKLNYTIPDLAGLWGTYSQSTIDAVARFQTDNGLPATGQVDAATWQKLQAAQC